MRIIDRYLLTTFGRMFLGVLVACAMLLLLTEILQRFQDIANNDCPWDQALLYFITFLPYRLIQILPLTTIIAVLFSIGALAHNHEMIAITAAGVAPARAARPLIIAGALISLGALAMAEFLVPPAETLSLDIRRVYIEGRGEGGKGRIMTENVSARGIDHLHYMMRRYRNREAIMEQPSILQLDAETGAPVWRLAATSATLIHANTASDGTLWRFYEARRYVFNDRGRMLQPVETSPTLELELEKNLHKYLASKRKPEEMGAIELAGFIAMLEAHGQPTGLYWTDFWLKLLFPMVSLIFVIAGFAFAMGAQIGSMVVGFAKGITFALIFYATIAVTQAMGHSGLLHPLISVIIPLILFAGLAVWFLKRSAYTMT